MSAKDKILTIVVFLFIGAFVMMIVDAYEVFIKCNNDYQGEFIAVAVIFVLMAIIMLLVWILEPRKQQ